MKEEKFIKEYIELRPLYKKLASTVAKIIEEILEINKINFHIVTFRTKTIESFSNKITKPKYDNPLQQLTDLAGIRIIGYVDEDVKKISSLIENTFEIDSSNSLDKSEELGIDRVGYRSVHFICELPKSRISLAEYKRFQGLKFEIQIRTILQHSWAEIEHDKNYKFSGELPKEIQRRFKLIAGTLEMADREFNQLSKEIDDYSKNVKQNTEKGELDIPLNSTSIKEFLNVKFKNSISKGILSPDYNGGGRQLLSELKAYGLSTLEDLNKIIPTDFENIHQKYVFNGNFMGLIRTILMINDVDKYFQFAWQRHWADLAPHSENILKEYKIDIKKIKDYLTK